MKKLILTRSQLKECLKEEAGQGNVAVGITAANNDVTGALNGSEVPEKIQNVKNASSNSEVNVKVTPKNGIGDTTVVADMPANGDSLSLAQQAATSNSDTYNELLNKGVNVEFPGVTEGKSFSKRDIEQKRLKVMEANGKVYTKKSLFESFFK